MSHSSDAAYQVTAAGAPPPSVAAPGSGSPYDYSAVPATGYPYSYPAAASSVVVNSGTQRYGDVSTGRNNNNFPYAHTPLSLPSTDATSAHGTHSRGPSSSNSQPVSQPSAEHGHDPAAQWGIREYHLTTGRKARRVRRARRLLTRRQSGLLFCIITRTVMFVYPLFSQAGRLKLWSSRSATLQINVESSFFSDDMDTTNAKTSKKRKQNLSKVAVQMSILGSLRNFPDPAKFKVQV
ncbi:hypothetical protein C8J57DRAFT_1580393 [Mycena rebaudengoi]|nr:hypothetical protein C8J57DRAFT_1580393 [Mycena rebaudengoi]